MGDGFLFFSFICFSDSIDDGRKRSQWFCFPFYEQEYWRVDWILGWLGQWMAWRRSGIWKREKVAFITFFFCKRDGSWKGQWETGKFQGIREAFGTLGKGKHSVLAGFRGFCF